MLDLISILKRTFGDVKNTGKVEVQCNCPNCSALYNNYEPDGKYNLAINLTKHKFQCWKCNLKGYLSFLLKRFADYADYKIYMSLDGVVDLKQYEDNVENLIITPKIHLPDEFIYFSELSETERLKNKGWNYLINKRGISEELILKFKLGFSPTGRYGGRVIFPSFDENNELNYFTARSYIESNKLKYFNPIVDKTKIIFNENNIKFYSTVYVVEGGLDIMGVPLNTSALLGKTLSLKFFEKIKQYNSNIVLILDPDAFWNTKSIFDALYFSGLKDNVKAVILKGEDDILDFSIKYEHQDLLNILYNANEVSNLEVFNQKYKLLNSKKLIKSKYTSNTKNYGNYK